MMNGGLCPSSSWGCEQEWEIGTNQEMAEKTCWVVGAVEACVKWASSALATTGLGQFHSQRSHPSEAWNNLEPYPAAQEPMI